MSTNRWVYEIATSKWMCGFRDASVYPGTPGYALEDLGEDAPWPDPIFERRNGGATHRRPATAPEIAESKNDQALAVAVQATKSKDLLTTLALIVRSRNINAWNGMTTPQKVTATKAEAQVWQTIRQWAEANL